MLRRPPALVKQQDGNEACARARKRRVVASPRWVWDSPPSRDHGAMAVFISPPSSIKAAALPSPPQPAALVCPQPAHFKGAPHGATTLSALFNHELGHLIVEAVEQPSGSGGLFPLHPPLASFLFIIFTLFSHRLRPLFSEHVCRIPI